jgi:hypothetical protein
VCDYSLHAFPNRLAVEGEDLVLHRFGGGSMGLASIADVRSSNAACVKKPFWAAVKDWFWGQLDSDLAIPAVCVPPGARLVLSDIPRSMQRDLGIGEVEEVKFVETSAEANTYRDAIRFPNNRQILLQLLREGQRVKVLSLDLEESETPAIREAQSLVL